MQEVFANDQRYIQTIQIVERGSFSTGKNGTATAVIFQRFISQGTTTNIVARIQIHFTMTPDGDIVTDITRIDTGC